MVLLKAAGVAPFHFRQRKEHQAIITMVEDFNYGWGGWRTVVKVKQ